MGVRSLFAGVSGLRNFQQQMDIIGNNIANSQTAGYKSSRMTFQDLLSQTTRGATGATGNVGGTNPLQFGLGASVGAIDTDFSQGNLLTTGRQLDLAITGNGFFKLSNGPDDFYSRNGAFGIDEAGYLVSTTSGYIVQGYMADQGVLDTTAVDDIQIPVGIVLPAEPTDTVDIVGNLNSTAEQIGSIHDSQALLSTETAGTSDIDGLFAVGSLNSRIAGMRPGVTTVTVTSNDGAADANFTLSYVAADTGGAGDGNFNTLAELVQEMNAALTNNFNATLPGDGSIAVTNGGGAAGTFTISSNNSALNSAFSSLIDNTFAAGATTNSDIFAHTATENDLMTTLRNGNGTSLGIAAGHVITFDGTVGGDTPPGADTYTVAAGSRLMDLDNSIATYFGIDNLEHNVETVGGRIRITGDGGSDYAIDDINITSTGGGEFDNIFNNSIGNWARIQSALDNHTTSFIAYDSDGVQHTVTLRFNIRDSIGGVGQWVFNPHSTVTASGAEDAVNITEGSIRFNGDGSLLEFSPQVITIVPGGGGIGNPINLTLDSGTLNSWDGLVSFENESSARFSNITGYASGELQNITVNAQGVITGNFTNGQNMTLAQLILSSFDNPEGLEKVGGNMFNQTLNSGVATDAPPGTGGRGTLIPSALEGSNVDLAQEFVTLITAQRGFQTNARMITAANDILGELVNLVR